MKHFIAVTVAMLVGAAQPAFAEAMHEGSETNMARSQTATTPAPASSAGGALSGRRADILPIARSIKPGGLSLALIDAVITHESGYRGSVRGARGEVGLMQILPATARSIARQHGFSDVAGMSHAQLVRYLSEPRNNLKLGLAYLNWCHDRANGNIGATIGCYNAGPGNMWRWSSIRVTRNYVRSVERHMASNSFFGS
jgi:soluble lytic murein transglycosylase-like protein